MHIIYHAGVVVKWQSSILIALRKHKNSHMQHWQFPQGRVEFGEDPLHAAKRELFEETGINPHHVEWYKKETSWLSYESLYKQHKIKFFYAYTFNKPNVKICRKEFIRYQWAEVDDLPKLFQFSFKRQVLDTAILML